MLDINLKHKTYVKNFLFLDKDNFFLLIIGKYCFPSNKKGTFACIQAKIPIYSGMQAKIPALSGSTRTIFFCLVTLKHQHVKKFLYFKLLCVQYKKGHTKVIVIEINGGYSPHSPTSLFYYFYVYPQINFKMNQCKA